MLAQPARHVVASLVLLNARVARWALAGVGKDPIGGFRFVAAFLGPFRQLGAGRWFVRLLATTHTERVATVAPHRGDAAAHGYFLAPRGGTVFHVVARLDEVADVKSVILVHQLGDSGGHLAGEAGGAGSVGAAAERRRGRHIALHRRVRSIRGSGGACGGDSSGRVILGSGQSVLQQIMKYRAGDNLGALELWAVGNNAGLAVVDLAGEIFRVAWSAELVPAPHTERGGGVVVTNAAAEGRGRRGGQACVG
mmetsp:Transcript_63818/g.112732  ORF Transcript_63818/g.112732 Transcript_63818/m.112732 type:complete len:252 (+) Transcript_63818:836-1591(+)